MKGFPTLKYFSTEDGFSNKAWAYNGGRNLEAFIEFSVNEGYKPKGEEEM